MSAAGPRTPSPPYGYARECPYDRDKQMQIVAQYHAHRIRPGRIAYRTGIDVAFIEALIAGELEAERFALLLGHYRKQRLGERLQAAERLRGAAAFEARERSLREFQRELVQ